MKKCQYCISEIPIQAKKCKYCGEWVEKKKKYPNELWDKVKSSTISIFENKSPKIQPRRPYELSNEVPFSIKKCDFYKTFLIYKTRRYNYEDIVSLYHKNSNARINYGTYLNFDLHLYFNLDSLNFPLEFRESLFKIRVSGQSKILIKRLLFITNILTERTYEQRLKVYRDSLNTLGYFSYPNNFKFYKNLNVLRNNKLKCNLKEMDDLGHVKYGISSQGHRSKTNDPYSFEISKPSWLMLIWFGMKLYPNVTINVNYDILIWEHLIFKEIPALIQIKNRD